MDTNDSVINLLQATLNPTQKDDAESQLKQISLSNGFGPLLLQTVVSDTYKMPVRQAAAIYFKNFISKNWNIIEGKNSILENDKMVIKDNIIEALIHSPDILRSQLALSLSPMIKYDYPDKWQKLLTKLENFIKDQNQNISLGGLICFHQLVKIFEYKKAKERDPLYKALNHIFPIICQKFHILLADISEKSVLMQKTIFKTFYTAIQFQFPPLLMNFEFFASWMHIFLTSLKTPIPESINNLEDDDDKMSSVWWKSKKWVLHIFCRICERYGMPSVVSKEYKDFAQMYMANYTGPILEVILTLLDYYRQGHYVSPRVLHYCFAYLTECISQSFTWKLVKPHLQIIIHEILFKLFIFNEEDQNLWENDPIEYIRTKFDIYENFGSPVTASQDFLFAVCVKRIGMLQEIATNTVNRLQQLQNDIVNNQLLATNPMEYNAKCRQIDALFNMLGTLAQPLISNLDKSKIKGQEVDYAPLTFIITSFVCPMFSSPIGFLRARACWMITQFRKMKIPTQTALPILNALKELFLTDSDLPVKVEASVALKSLIQASDPQIKEALAPNLKEIISEMLNILKQTLSEEMTIVLKKILCIYSENVKPLILEMLNHISSILESTEAKKDDDEVRIFISGLLEIVETLVDLLEQNRDAIITITDSVLNIINIVVTRYHTEECSEDFYDEVISISRVLTAHLITANDWNLLPMLYTIYLKDKESFFVEIVPVLYNFLSNDKPALERDPSRFQVIITMCKEVLEAHYMDEEMEMHALKLFEIILFDYPGYREQVISIVLPIVFKRLFESFHPLEAKTYYKNVNVNNQSQQPPIQPNHDGHEEDDDDDDKYIMTQNCESMNIQIVMTCLFLNPTLTLTNLANLQCANNDKYHIPNYNTDAHPPSFFLNELINKAFANAEFLPGIHDNKVFVLGITTLLNLSNENRRHIKYFMENPNLISNLLIVFDVIKKHRRARGAESESSWADEAETFASDDDEDFEYIEPTVDDADCLEESRKKYLEDVAPSNNMEEGDKIGEPNRLIDSSHPMIDDEGAEDIEVENDYEDEEEDDDEYGLEYYVCSIDGLHSPIDEVVIFQDTIKNLQLTDPEYYAYITSKLTKNEQTRFKGVLSLANALRMVKNL